MIIELNTKPHSEILFSCRVFQVMEVLRLMKEEIFRRAQLEEDIWEEHLKDIYRQAINEVANTLGLLPWTVESKITTQLGISSRDQIVKLIKDFFVSPQPVNSPLGQTILAKRTRFDNRTDIEIALSRI